MPRRLVMISTAGSHPERLHRCLTPADAGSAMHHSTNVQGHLAAGTWDQPITKSRRIYLGHCCQAGVRSWAADSMAGNVESGAQSWMIHGIWSLALLLICSCQ